MDVQIRVREVDVPVCGMPPNIVWKTNPAARRGYTAGGGKRWWFSLGRRTGGRKYLLCSTWHNIARKMVRHSKNMFFVIVVWNVHATVHKYYTAVVVHWFSRASNLHNSYHTYNSRTINLWFSWIDSFYGIYPSPLHTQGFSCFIFFFVFTRCTRTINRSLKKNRRLKGGGGRGGVYCVEQVKWWTKYYYCSFPHHKSFAAWSACLDGNMAPYIIYVMTCWTSNIKL